MGQCVAVSLATVLACVSGCTVAGRTSTGGATAKPGVEPGTTRSIYIADRGGLLTRLGLGTVGAAATMGSVKSASSTTREVGRDDKYIYTETTNTITVDPAAAQRAQSILDRANDWNDELTGLTGGLEIASRDFGGDTSGWMFDFGAVASTPFGATSPWALRTAIKMKFGRMTFHDRMKRVHTGNTLVFDTTSEEETFTMIGLPLRGGITYRGLIEAFFQLDLNMVTVMREMVGDPASPSPWRTGLRLQVKWFYVEGELAWSAFREDNKSIGLEAGLAF